MTDREHGDAVRRCIGELQKAVHAARKSGLRVELQLAVIDGLSEDREFDPHNAVAISREA
jgi:hypothetical protein